MPATTHRSFPVRVAVVLLTFVPITALAAGPSNNFAIEDQASYNAFVTAITQAEYIRDDYITGSIPVYIDGEYVEEWDGAPAPGTKPRVLGTIAAGMAFMERNPDAGGDAFDSFLTKFDEKLADYASDDPNLTRPSNFLAAMRGTRVLSGVTDSEVGRMRGYDTDVSERALELLGIRLAVADSTDGLERRIATFERAVVRRLGTSAEVAVLLAHGLLRQNPDGSRHDTNFSDELEDYIISEGYFSAFDSAFPKPDIDAAIAELPTTYAAYETEVTESLTEYAYDEGNETLEEYRARTANLDANPFQGRIREAIYGVFDASDVLAGEIGDELTLAETQALTDADYAAIGLERRAALRAVAGNRTSISANSILLYQNIAAADYAERQLNMGAAVIGQNKNWTDAKAGVQLGLSAGGVALAILADDPVSAYGFAADMVMTSLDLAENQSNGITLDDIYVQIREVQVQIQQMQTQLNERFDRVDQKLDTIFGTMVRGFDVLVAGQADIQASINAAIDLIQRDAKSTFKLENTILAVGAEQMDALFELTANARLGQRASGTDFPYDNGTDGDFVSAASEFATFAIDTSDNIVYTGDPSSPFLLDEASETFDPDPNVDGSTDTVISSRINELLVNSTAFLGNAPSVPLPPSVPGPEPWSLAASAYLQLVDESPWYFARLYAGQLNTQAAGGSAPELDRMIERGERLLRLTRAFRQTETNDDGVAEPVLFRELVADYKAATADIQAHVDDSISRYLARDTTVGPELVDVALKNDLQQLDLWLTDPTVNVTDLADRISTIHGTRGHQDDLSLPNAGQEGYRSITGIDINANGVDQRDRARRSQLNSLLIAALNDGEYRKVYWDFTSPIFSPFIVRFKLENNLGDGGFADGQEQFRDLEVRRQVRGRIAGDTYGSWESAPYDTQTEWSEFLERIWPAMRDHFATGERYDEFETAGIFDAGSFQERLRVVSDTSGGTGPIKVEERIARRLGDIRSDLRSAILADMTSPGTNTYNGISLADRIKSLDDIEALIDAYATVAFPAAMESSTILRSALRGAEPNRTSGVAGSEVGIRRADLLELVHKFFDADDAMELDWGDAAYDLPAIEDILNARIDVIYDELVSAVDSPVETAPYVSYVLAELKALRERYNDLGVDDTYKSQLAGATQSLLDNDTLQVRFVQQIGGGAFETIYRELELDTTFGDPNDAIPDDGYVAPSNGSVTLYADGTFVYTPDTGFTGTDYFTYRTRCNIAPAANPPPSPIYAFSQPVWVRVKVTNCPIDIDDNGSIDAFDIVEYVGTGTDAPSIEGIVGQAIQGCD